VITEVNPGVRSIQFTEECVKNCLLCARYCTYGAIMPRKEGAN
jgi:NAD-dependent dihydropyrimidine dehydrogenase PreA subunit